MAKVYLVNFATPEFYESQERLNKLALKFGIDKVFSYTMNIIKKTKFYKENKKLLDEKQRAGFACWKPYIILDVLKKIKDGGVLIYCDSGISLKKKFMDIIEKYKKENIVLFESTPINRQYTKRDCFVLMNCDKEIYHNARQIMGGLNLWKKTKITQKIVLEWLEFCKDERIIGDKSNQCGYPNFSDFIEHRWDQSVLSILAVKYRKYIKKIDERRYVIYNKKLKCYECSLWDVHRKRKRNFWGKIIFNIKLMIPVSFKNKIKWFINHYIKK